VSDRNRWGLVGCATFLGLLLASHVVRSEGGRNDALEPGVTVVSVPEVDGEATTGREVRIAFEQRGPAEPRGLPVVLLHGSPGGRGDFASLGGALARERRTIAPDLPGFGASASDVADYSARAHARYVSELLDELDIERAHMIGFSMGGGVALELSELDRERVASVTLLSSIGVQELELLGDYHLNHAIHGLQLALLWSVHELVPHFGLLDGGMLSVEYARNFYDTDQRPLRARLTAFEAPMLVLHGEHDVLVPFAAAREHHRLVPQSELVAFDANHFLVFRRGEELAERVRPFFERVEAGRAATRATAGADRLRAAAEPFDARALEPVSGFALATLLVLAALATLVSEDLTCIGVGALIGQGRLAFLPGVAACVVGIYVGDILLFLAGRLFGRRAVGRWPLRLFLSEERVERSSQWFESRGPFVIFASRFLPGLRLPTYFAAGVLRTSFARFTFWFALAALLWTPLLVALSGMLAGTLSERLGFLRENLALAFLATVALAFFLVKVAGPMTTHRGRRLLLGSWRRKVRWEYWPRTVFYAPVVLACVWFALRRRSALAFTASNPAIPHGGVVGESKADILRGLGVRAGARLARTLVVPGGAARGADGERERALRDFRSRLARPWPVVVKPDVGQRGDGVHVVRSEEELAAALASLAGRVLVQEFVDGPEFGLFWARHPEDARGRILSIARKVLPSVVGDGRRTLEALILDDQRAVVSAPLFLARHARRLGDVPAAGERVQLGELGTHCRGAVFQDGRDLLTPELFAAVEETASAFEGFCFGRFDVRAPSEEALRAGEFRVLELNGVTSEAAHVYDPAFSALDGWRTIIEQWGLAFAIGAANARRGARVSGLSELLVALARYRRGPSSELPVALEEIPAP